jgi:hypothetical protein
MDKPHEAHLARVQQRCAEMLDKKYRKGQAEHGGSLWMKPGLLDMAIDEAIDQVVYLLTLKEQLDGKRQ